MPICSPKPSENDDDNIDDKEGGILSSLLRAPFSRSLLGSPLVLAAIRQAASSNRIFKLLNALVARCLPTVRYLLEDHLRKVAKDPDGILPPIPPDVSKASHESAHNHPGVVLLERQIRILQRQVDLLKGVPPHRVDMRTGRA
jgi:hypothetical protein